MTGVSEILKIALRFEKFDKIFHIFRFNKSDKSSIFRHSHKGISLDDFEHITDIFRDDDLSFSPDSDRSVHLDSSIDRSRLFFLSEHMYNKLEK